MSARPTTVVFDFGGVLIQWAPRTVVNAFYPDRAQQDKIMREVFQHADWLEYDRGTFAEHELVVRFAARTGESEASIVKLLGAVRESLQPLEETVTLLGKLAAREVPLYGLTNMHGETFQFLKSRDDFWSLFKGVVVSGEVKLVKPDRKIFEHLLSEHGLRAQDVVFIDDLEANVLGARSAGLHAIQFKDAASCARQLYALLGIDPA
ncbi:MAG TPA: HAD family phosphatase [Steroidobacteraceae bacterium]|jgi:FMN phosphatase YigB (HAD superfamily)